MKMSEQDPLNFGKCAECRATVEIPSAAGHIMMNLWNVADTNAGWAGKFDDSKLPVTAQYQWIGYKSAE